jgi:hypothetical protein
VLQRERVGIRDQVLISPVHEESVKLEDVLVPEADITAHAVKRLMNRS